MRHVCMPLLLRTTRILICICNVSKKATKDFICVQFCKEREKPHLKSIQLSKLANKKNHFYICIFSPTGLVPEVPLLQAFENEVGRGWTRLIIATFTIICFCSTLLELSLPLHRMVSKLINRQLYNQGNSITKVIPINQHLPNCLKGVTTLRINHY